MGWNRTTEEGGKEMRGQTCVMKMGSNDLCIKPAFSKVLFGF